MASVSEQSLIVADVVDAVLHVSFKEQVAFAPDLTRVAFALSPPSPTFPNGLE